ncbi:MAG TPA: carboxypeptidase regulatory-like domain-containing protein, partial [Acidobacteria bacterium]|nr:carboxypeptidase regulatory-like domain-containing protein [Acidobacteriota bacterium]
MARGTKQRRWVSLLAGLISIGAAASAQTNTGEIGGVVVDASGGVLPGTTVVATHPASGFTIERVTDAGGRFFLPALPTGGWEVTAELPGFQRVTQTGITLELGRTLQLEFTLSLGAISEEVTVVITPPLLQVTTAEISDVIEAREVEQIPLNGRQFLQLAQLSDAVVIPPGGTRGGALQQAGPLPNIGGQRAGHNIYMLDGFKVTDELFNNLVINPSVDSIQEFKIQKSMYPPEFGGKASALINVATKAGSNRVHGSLFEFVRDDRFDAHNFFDDKRAPVPPLEQHQFGGALGGRLVHNRTFFFVSY